MKKASARTATNINENNRLAPHCKSIVFYKNNFVNWKKSNSNSKWYIDKINEQIHTKSSPLINGSL